MKKFLKENRSGFTLIELLVVIAILAVLATLYVPRIISSSTDAKKQVAISNARTLASEIMMYNAGHTPVFLGTGDIDAEGTSISSANQALYKDNCTIVTEADVKGTATGSTTPAAIKELLTAREFPSNTYVLIITDNKGNCFILKPDGSNITA